MLRQAIRTIRNWLAPVKATGEKEYEPSTSQSRRHFFRRAVVGTASISATAGLAKVVADAIPEADIKERYVKDNRMGEKELSNREYVLMSDQEKADTIKTLIDNYTGPA